jgi:phosphoglycolate phosphatase
LIRLVVLDCDGTLVDSQHVIFESMRRALVDHALPVPPIEDVRRVVGLSLVEGAKALLPHLDEATALALAASYKERFQELRRRDGVLEPLFPGVAETLVHLDRQGVLLAVATGKSRRGLDRVLAHHGLDGLFVSLQTADAHPSKPHPSMLEQAMRDAGCAPEETLLVGDTTFDIDMAARAGAGPVGVAWGYHPVADLRRAGATTILESFPELAALAGATG